MREYKREEEKRRNPLTIRWTDDEHRAVANQAWQKHRSASAFVREIVITHLDSQGVVGRKND